jgi:hypothetical protein
MVAILSPPSLYGGKQNMKLPLLHNRRYTPLRALRGFVVVAPSEGCASIASLRSTNATLAIMPCVVCFKANQRPRPQTDQTGFTNSPNRFQPDSHTESSVLTLSLKQVTQWFCGEPLETQRRWCALPPISTHDLAH